MRSRARRAELRIACAGLHSILSPWRLPRNLVFLLACYYFYESWNAHNLWLLAFRLQKVPTTRISRDTVVLVVQRGADRVAD